LLPPPLAAQAGGRINPQKNNEPMRPDDLLLKEGNAATTEPGAQLPMAKSQRQGGLLT